MPKTNTRPKLTIIKTTNKQPMKHKEIRKDLPMTYINGRTDQGSSNGLEDISVIQFANEKWISSMKKRLWHLGYRVPGEEMVSIHNN